MKKETLAKISALTLAAMLLTSCNNNPAVTTDKPVTTEPTPSTSQSEVVNHVDFDYPDPSFEERIKKDSQVDDSEIKYIDWQLVKHAEPYAYVGFRIDNKDYQKGIVYHKFKYQYFREVVYKHQDTIDGTYFSLACGKDNNSEDKIDNAYYYPSNYVDPTFNGVNRMYPSNKIFLCDTCFNNEDDILKFKSKVSELASDDLKHYYISPEIEFKKESELEK